jgi:hypothetical protein
MATFLFQCPNTHRRVQGWVADEPKTDSTQTFVPVTCLACRAIHLVNPETGKTAGE